MADWVTYMDPQLWRGNLKDDIRAWPGGITKNEAALKDVAAPAVDGALPQVRTSAALEPMFAIGDRKLELKKQPELKNPNEGRDPRELVEELGLNWDDLSTYEKHVYTDRTLPYNNPQHFYSFHDENGNAVGQLVIHPDPKSKQLYVDWVGGVGKFGPSSFGPSLIRDIKRQLKEIYPEYESITGHRVSGARYKSIVNAEAARLAAEDGLDLVTLPAHIADKYYEHAEATVKNPTDHPVVKLALSDAFEMSKEYNDLRNILDTAPTKFGDVPQT